MSDIVQLLKTKLFQAKVKIETVLEMCLQMDRNNDKLIHMDDLKSILRHLLNEECPSRREV
jgi:hypothetical protein